MNTLKSNTKELWLIINGVGYVLNYPISLEEILCFLNIPQSQYIIEKNYKILKIENTSLSLNLQPFDSIELITIVGGG